MQTESSQLKQYRSPGLNYARGAGHVFLPWHVKRASCLPCACKKLRQFCRIHRSRSVHRPRICSHLIITVLRMVGTVLTKF